MKTTSNLNFQYIFSTKCISMAAPTGTTTNLKVEAASSAKSQ